MSRPRFFMLDAMRGVAALAIMVFHSPAGLAPHGYLAVDLFFVMSGFVIADAYEDRLKAGWAFGAFLKARLIRLYPLYALGLALGAGVMLVTGDAYVAAPGGARLDTGTLFALDAPFWSLVCEMAANLVYGLVAPRLNDAALYGLVVGFGLLLTAIGLHHGSLEVGLDSLTSMGGLARAGFGFSAGLLIHRLWRRGAFAGRRAVSPLLIAGGFVLIVALPRAGPAIDLAAVLVAMPLLVAAAVQARPRSPNLCERLGDMSYPLYALHFPLMWLAHKSGGSVVAFGCAWGAAIMLAFAADRWFDRPVRRWLTDALAPVRAVPLAEARTP